MMALANLSLIFCLLLFKVLSCPVNMIIPHMHMNTHNTCAVSRKMHQYFRAVLYVYNKVHKQLNNLHGQCTVSVYPKTQGTCSCYASHNATINFSSFFL